MSFLSLIPIVSNIVDYFTRRVDADVEKYKVKGEIDKEALRQDTEIIKARADLAKARSDSTTDAVGRALLIYPVGIWFSLIIFDSIFRMNSFMSQFTWRILDLPKGLQYIPYAAVAYLLVTNWKQK